MQKLSFEHLAELEAEAIEILREVVASMENPVLMYSIGKDSNVLLHLAIKAFYPSPPPLSFLHIDTTWKFSEMIAFRDAIFEKHNLKIQVFKNQKGVEDNINPFEHGAAYTDIMKTQALKTALNEGMFDAVIGGARRDEEKSRAKERIFSFRTENHSWDPKKQRPEVWNLYNTKISEGESIRVFPLSNWTELDIWLYIYLNNISIPSLYFAAPRPVVNRNGMFVMVDDDRYPLLPGEAPEMKSVRFRTLGCYPLTGAIESNSATLEEIIVEMEESRSSERHTRLIDTQHGSSMEKKKREGYF